MNDSKYQILFDENVGNTMGKKDGLYSVIYYVGYMVFIYLLGLLMFRTSIYRDLSSYFTSKLLFRFLFYIPITIVSLLPVFVILVIRRQGVESIGITKNKLGRSILIGLIGSIPFSLVNMVGPISSGKSLNPNPSDWLWDFLYYLFCIAFVEEVIFRGFLQTRIFALIKNKWTGIVVAGAMFALMHVPFQMVQANIPPIKFLLNDIWHLLNTALIHIYLVFLYTRDNNILAPTIAHAIINFSFAIFI